MTNNTIHNVPRELLERAWRALANSATGREIGAYLDADPCAPECAETCARASMCSTCSATLSAQPPAGADGLEVVAWVTTGFSGKSRTRRAFTVNADDAARQHTNWTPHYRQVNTDQLCRLSDAHAIIDGLRGEVADLHTTMMAAAVEIQEHWAAHCDEDGYGPANLMHRLERGIASQYGYNAKTLVRLEAERDQHAQRIGELEGLLREFAVGISKREMPTELELNGWFYRIDSAMSAVKDSDQ